MAWNSTDLSNAFSGIHPRANAQELLTILIYNMCLEITFL